MLAATARAITDNSTKKGDVLATARVAGIQAATHGSSLVPLSIPVVPDIVYVEFSVADTHVDITVIVDAPSAPGTELSARIAVTVAALTIFDMCKAADRTMVIGSASS